jgi:4-amino-4-deoxychorismate lyase
MNHVILSGGQAVHSLDPTDRGLAYGDGVFETVLFHCGRLVWWTEHWERLRRGAEALGLLLPDPVRLHAEVESLVSGHAHGVLKMILTRGPGGRGYRPPPMQVPTGVLSVHDVPMPPPAQGMGLRWCDTRLAIQPRLAGFKHLNRLEQVLARAEWDDPGTHEGLMRDTEGYVVCATAANLFIRSEGRWLTPPVDRCGIAGICRAWARSALAADERRLTVRDIEEAEALFLCNSVRGILPVARLDARLWEPDPEVGALIDRLAREQPAFAKAFEGRA